MLQLLSLGFVCLLLVLFVCFIFWFPIISSQLRDHPQHSLEEQRKLGTSWVLANRSQLIDFFFYPGHCRLSVPLFSMKLISEAQHKPGVSSQECLSAAFSPQWQVTSGRPQAEKDTQSRTTEKAWNFHLSEKRSRSRVVKDKRLWGTWLEENNCLKVMTIF